MEQLVNGSNHNFSIGASVKTIWKMENEKPLATPVNPAYCQCIVCKKHWSGQKISMDDLTKGTN